ncbi:MAG: glutamate-5-semialdehyde dehydrogenase [Alphaproteobacteria bacterium]|jgi:glutamate-5-semialdehyde dehydrogenase|nr:glutamate-5-semialdehyde dehydrogenase [Alphaproteobacteria bacterium]
MALNKSEEIIQKIAKQAKKAYQNLNLTSTEQKNNALKIAAKLILEKTSEIIEINQLDLHNARDNGKDHAFIDRLKLDKNRIKAMSESLTNIANLPDPVGNLTFENKRPNGLNIKRITIPLGVIAIIYEARPNVTSDAFGLCLKSGNATILRPGSDSFLTSKFILELLQEALKQADLPIDSAQILPSSERSLVDEMLKCVDYIDVIVPRGGKSLIQAISAKSKIPIFKHLDGNCHTYIHEKADFNKAINIIYNAKLRRTGICGATESVVIDQKIIADIAPLIEEKFANECVIKADEIALKHLKNAVQIDDTDFAKEYLSNIFSIKVTKDINEAILHINKYSSGHTEAIITEDKNAASSFLKAIDSAIVMHNTSTQFADGAEFGLGAEIGISTGRMHARGPVGLEQLVTYKYIVEGTGQIRA